MKRAFSRVAGFFHNPVSLNESRMQNISFFPACFASFPIKYRILCNISKLIEIMGEKLRKIFLPGIIMTGRILINLDKNITLLISGARMPAVF